ncbi:hypothetical protein BGX38DRAFT_1236490 [Terfezia claveryi]|nr:hypothetical protein BGX38DRAFT_1236490 [Terfezia claveryi]
MQAVGKRRTIRNRYGSTGDINPTFTLSLESGTNPAKPRKAYLRCGSAEWLRITLGPERKVAKMSGAMAVVPVNGDLGLSLLTTSVVFASFSRNVVCHYVVWLARLSSESIITTHATHRVRRNMSRRVWRALEFEVFLDEASKGTFHKSQECGRWPKQRRLFGIAVVGQGFRSIYIVILTAALFY